jgi:hypothetical protein
MQDFLPQIGRSFWENRKLKAFFGHTRFMTFSLISYGGVDSNYRGKLQQGFEGVLFQSAGSKIVVRPNLKTIMTRFSL